MTARMPTATVEVDPAYTAGGATDVELAAAAAAATAALNAHAAGDATDAELAAAVAALNAALTSKQDAAVAATDAELAAAIAIVNAALAAKQESATAATDAELVAAVAALEALLATKQDAATAATDVELAGAIAAHAAGDATDAELAVAVAALEASLAGKQDAATAATDSEVIAAIAAHAAGDASDAELAAEVAALLASIGAQTDAAELAAAIAAHAAGDATDAELEAAVADLEDQIAASGGGRSVRLVDNEDATLTADDDVLIFDNRESVEESSPGGEHWGIYWQTDEAPYQPTAGTFTVSWDAEETDPLDFDADAAALTAALEALPGVGVGDFEIGGGFAFGGFDVYAAGALGGQDLDEDRLTCDLSDLSNGNPPPGSSGVSHFSDGYPAVAEVAYTLTIPAGAGIPVGATFDLLYRHFPVDPYVRVAVAAGVKLGPSGPLEPDQPDYGYWLGPIGNHRWAVEATGSDLFSLEWVENATTAEDLDPTWNAAALKAALLSAWDVAADYLTVTGPPGDWLIEVDSDNDQGELIVGGPGAGNVTATVERVGQGPAYLVEWFAGAPRLIKIAADEWWHQGLSAG